MVEKPKTEVHTDNGLPPSMPSGRVSCSSSGDRRFKWLRKSLTVLIWQHDYRTYDYKIILSYLRKLMENKSEKEAVKGPGFFFKKLLELMIDD